MLFLQYLLCIRDFVSYLFLKLMENNSNEYFHLSGDNRCPN